MTGRRVRSKYYWTKLTVFVEIPSKLSCSYIKCTNHNYGTAHSTSTAAQHSACTLRGAHRSHTSTSTTDVYFLMPSDTKNTHEAMDMEGASVLSAWAREDMLPSAWCTALLWFAGVGLPYRFCLFSFFIYFYTSIHNQSRITYNVII
ncbi:unnamed protein product [Laminaria digitata]